MVVCGLSRITGTFWWKISVKLFKIYFQCCEFHKEQNPRNTYLKTWTKQAKTKTAWPDTSQGWSDHLTYPQFPLKHNGKHWLNGQRSIWKQIHENNMGRLRRVSKISAVTAANCSALRNNDVHGSHFSTSVSLTIQICVILVSTVVPLSYFCPRQSQRR